jgi:hypothetical protein
MFEGEHTGPGKTICDLCERALTTARRMNMQPHPHFDALKDDTPPPPIVEPPPSPSTLFHIQFTYLVIGFTALAIVASVFFSEYSVSIAAR